MVGIVACSVDELYQKCLTQLFERGEETHPRGFNCRELSPCSTTLLEPQRNILTNPIRKASRAFMAAELLWILMGRDDVEMISFYNSKISSFSDDGIKFFGAYGPKIIGQLEYVVNSIQQDPWTRQAIITIWRECPSKSKDIPCTVAMHFIQRPAGVLNLIVYMRSQDVWLGFPYDVHNFTSLQSIIASMLNIKLGTFTLIQGSLHMYEENEEKAKATKDFFSVSGTTPLSTLKTTAIFSVDVKLTEEKYRCNEAPGRYLFDCPLIQQKMDWLYAFATNKHATSNH